ncbi:hypothetical protein [Bremerella alba]|uniref:Carboxypeptidase regulatory-like domain-containing protein n=1 Tax=Bremerella alba TaxID=980252 RepID=A0A7V9A5R1_9BACT|nr:hypothetical protein [Bremerella alba]MBA2113630.1 hypothetical protein [Bremerella alba]
MSRSVSVLLTLILLSAINSGCGVVSSPATVDGQVLINGKPADDVQLTLWLADVEVTGASATVRTDSQGHFHITSDSNLTAGEYHVTFEKFALPNGKAPSPDMKPSESGAKNVIPEQYQSPSTTTVRLTAPVKDAILDVTLQSRSGGKLRVGQTRSRHGSKS